MEIEGYTFPDDLYYHKEHFWAKVEGEIVTVGTTDFAQKLAGDIVFVRCLQLAKRLNRGSPVAPWNPENGLGGSVLFYEEFLEDVLDCQQQ